MHAFCTYELEMHHRVFTAIPFPDVTSGMYDDVTFRRTRLLFRVQDMAPANFAIQFRQPLLQKVDDAGRKTQSFDEYKEVALVRSAFAACERRMISELLQFSS